MADVVKLRKQRSYIKGKLIRIEQAVAQIQRQEAHLLDREDAEGRLERLDQVIREFQDIQRQIINEIDELSVADTTIEVEFEAKSLAARTLLRRIINSSRGEGVGTRASEADSAITQLLQRQMTIMERYEANGTAQARTSPEAAIGQDEGESLRNLLKIQTELLQRIATDNEGAVGNRVKLPTLKLPSFDGKIEEWAKFSDEFTNAVHNNQALPNVQKFIYLRSCISGAAARAIEDIELFNDNYTVAWEQLQKRFEDSGIVKRKHVQCLIEMPIVEKESASAILQLVDHVNKHTRVLKRLDSPTDSWDDLLIYMMETKLDRVILRAWEERGNIRANSDDPEERREVKLNDLMEFLIQRYHALEGIESSKNRSNQDKNVTKIQGQTRVHGKSNQSKSSMAERVTSLASSIKNACLLCNDAHALYCYVLRTPRFPPFKDG